MTKANAKEILERHVEGLKECPYVIVDDRLYEAFDLAIEALKERSNGEWLNSGMDLYCSNCNYRTNTYHLLGRFCPNCGAKMLEDEE